MSADIEAVKARLADLRAMYIKSAENNEAIMAGLESAHRQTAEDLAVILEYCTELDLDQHHSLSVIAECQTRAETAEDRLAKVVWALGRAGYPGLAEQLGKG